jgi:hypothetical protein
VKKIVVALAAVAAAIFVVAKKKKVEQPESIEQAAERLRPIWPYGWRG